MLKTSAKNSAKEAIISLWKSALAKISTIYLCEECGAQSPVKLGRCPRCDSWGSMHEVNQSGKVAASQSTRNALSTEVSSLKQVSPESLLRQSSGIDEVDRVLGGGWVPGSVILLAGEPGIGKSTLLLQLADYASRNKREVFYIAGEESLSQIRLRAERLGLAADVQITRETYAPVLSDYLRLNRPDLIIVDSIQTLSAQEGGIPGSLTQVRDSTAILAACAKDIEATLVIIGHITKQGSIAGPKQIEHMVDATFALETAAGFRVMRAIKNRYGPAGEMGVFEMTAGGMMPISNPSEAFLAAKPKGVPGSVVVAALEGQRPIMLEVQALAAKSPYPAPRRVVQGLDQRRVDVVLAVLERRLELSLSSLDVYVNVAGGLKLTDPGADLAVAIAVYSAVTNQVVKDDIAVVGEVGLAGELRAAAQLERRIEAAKRAGFKRIISAGDTKKVTRQLNLAQAIEAVWHAE